MNDIVVKTDKFEINNKNLVIGKQGENIARQIVFDFSAWHEKFGEGTLTLFVKRHGEDASYPVIPVIEQTTTARWNISSIDTAIYGSGSAELRYVVNNVVVKSETFPTFVYRSITETTAPTPDPYESWVETLVALGDETRIYAERVDAAASSAESANTSAQAAAESAESYSSHPPRIGDNGNWELWNGTTYVSSAYPSRGERGEQGERGEKGDKGDPGQAGSDGITPHIGENGNWFIGEFDTGISASGTPDAVQYVAQELTETEQKQARRNISAQSQVYAVSSGNPWSADDCVNAPARSVKLYGASEQNGVPSPDNPIPIKCNDLTYTLSNDADFDGGIVTAPELYAIGDVRDEFDAVTGHGVRRIKKLVFDGTENWIGGMGIFDKSDACARRIMLTDPSPDKVYTIICNSLVYSGNMDIWNSVGRPNTARIVNKDQLHLNIANDILGVNPEINTTEEITEAFKSFLAEKYAAGDPVEVYYILETPTEFTAEPTQFITPDGYCQIIPSGEGVAGEVEVEYAVDIEKRYVPKTKYDELEARVQALEANAIGG